MKIRDKLFLGFGSYILLGALLGLIAYGELRTIKRGLALVEKADDITNTFLEVRRYEKNFLLYRDRESRKELLKYLASFTSAIEAIEAEIISEIGEENYGHLGRSLTVYGRNIHGVMENLDSREPLMDRMRIQARELEHRLTGAEHDFFLNVRRHEKNLMLERSTESYAAFREALEASGLQDRRGVAEYAGTITGLHELYVTENAAEEEMRQAAREIQAFTESLAHEEREKISTTLKIAGLLLVAGMALIVVVGTVINHKMAQSIVDPILGLEQATKKISRGDFSGTIEVNGNDEIASLAASFNQMEEKLDHAMTALDGIIKKLQEKQAQLVEAEKLALIGKLAAGIAHEINNPLTSVLTFSNLMLEQCPTGDPRHERLKLMVKETDRARTIVRQLLNFGRESVLKPEKIDINRPVREIADSMVAQEAFPGIELALRLDENLPEVYADPAQLGQVVLNMLLNAIHAITPPGRIEVATRMGEGHVEIVIADSGQGIPEEHLRRIFDPFFTTKDAAKGTGLGLAVSYGIIQKHGGDISVESTVGKGTTFTVRMPVYG